MKLRIIAFLLVATALCSCNVIYQTRIQANIYEAADVKDTDGWNKKRDELRAVLIEFTEKYGFDCKEDNDALYDINCFDQQNYINLFINFGTDAAFITVFKQHASALSEPKQYTHIKSELESLLNKKYGDSRVIVIE